MRAAALFLSAVLLSPGGAGAFFWKKKPDPAHEKLLQEAVAGLEAGDCGTAVASINSLLELSPARGIKERAYYCLGKCQEALGASDKAMASYRLAAALYPDNPLFPRALADLYLANGFYDKAVPLYLPLLKKEPGSVPLNLGLARSYAGLGALAQAAASYADAREAGASGPAFLSEYAGCLEAARDFAGAAALLEEAKAAAPADRGVVGALARLKARSGDYARAAELAAEACGADCRDGDLFFERGLYLLFAGDRKGALAAFDEAGRFLPEGDQPLALARGLALRALGRGGEAARALGEAAAGESRFLAGFAQAAGGGR